MSDGEAQWKPVLSFHNGSEDYVHGFEAGGVWEVLRRQQPAEYELTVNAANEEQYHAVARACGYTVELSPLSDGWLSARFERHRGRLEAG